MDIQANLKEVIAELPTNVRLVAVSKFHPAEAIEAAYSAGQRIFGESKEQELSGKHEQLPKDIEWHFIGHLQPNKVKYYSLLTRNSHSTGRKQIWLYIRQLSGNASYRRMEKSEQYLYRRCYGYGDEY